MPTIFEPFRIKVVEPIRISTETERGKWLKEAGYNLFNLHAEQVMIDLLTDSGTSAMSQEQWSAIFSGDESYAGSRSFYELENVAKDLFAKEIIIPVHQGRAGEHMLFSTLVKSGHRVPSNGHFDTTAANIADNGGEAVNLPSPESREPERAFPFKGNIDLAALREFLTANEAAVPFVLLTITNNFGGGQPVSLANIKAAHALCREFGKPLFLDACRFAENAYLIKLREKEYSSWSAKEIAQEIFRLADVVTFSGKKDALVNIGGLVCLNDRVLGEKLKNRLIVTEGFATYGGLAGRDLAAMAQGLREVVDEHYLHYRIRTIEWMVERLLDQKIPVIVPAGGHGIYLDAARFLSHLVKDDLPGIALAAELYLKGGIRGAELGNVAFGRKNEQGENVYPPLDLVRLAMPRRVYTEAHAGYVVEKIVAIFQRREKIGGYRFEVEAPVMRHFRSTFAPK